MFLKAYVGSEFCSCFRSGLAFGAKLCVFGLTRAAHFLGAVGTIPDTGALQPYLLQRHEGCHPAFLDKCSLVST